MWKDDIATKTSSADEYLIFGQHYGLIDIIKVDTGKKVLSMNLPKVNTIFNILLTSHRSEVCFCSYNGLYFAKIKKDATKGGLTMELSLSETYFTDKYVSRGVEYAPDKFVVCIQDDDQFYTIDRTKRQVVSKISWGIPEKYHNSYNFEVIKLPGYSLKKFPFLLMRDDYGIKIFNVDTKRLVKVKDA